jgi:hypothetical protein
MRIYIFIFLSGLLSCNQPVKGPRGKLYKNAAEYNNHIISRQQKVMIDIGKFVSLSNTDLDSALIFLKICTDSTDARIRDIEEMPLFKGDSSLKNSALDLFRFYRRVFSEDYASLIVFWREHGRATPEGIAETNRVIKQISVDEEKLDKRFHNVQTDFAEKYHMKMEEKQTD